MTSVTSAFCLVVRTATEFDEEIKPLANLGLQLLNEVDSMRKSFESAVTQTSQLRQVVLPNASSQVETAAGIQLIIGRIQPQKADIQDNVSFGNHILTKIDSLFRINERLCQLYLDKLTAVTNIAIETQDVTVIPILYEATEEHKWYNEQNFSFRIQAWKESVQAGITQLHSFQDLPE